MLRYIKIMLVLTVAGFGFIGAFGNLADWEGTIGGVGAATSMATFEGGAESWRATDNPLLIGIAAVIIPLLKFGSGVLCLWGSVTMWQARSGAASVFDLAKQPALAGMGVAILLLFGGWIVLAETWFEMWRSDVLRDASLESAFRYIGSIGVIALFVALRDEAAPA